MSKSNDRIHNMQRMKAQLGLIPNNPTFAMPNYKQIKKQRSKFITLEPSHVQADLMFFSWFNGYKYLLTVVDKMSRAFDCEALKEKSSRAIIQGFEKILSRPYITVITSIDFDQGGEFNSAEFREYANSKNITLFPSRVGRKRQTGFIESYNFIVSQLISVKIEEDHMKHPTRGYDWVKYLPKLREIMNQDLNVVFPTIQQAFFKGNTDTPNYAGVRKFHNIGQMVYVINEEPRDPVTNKKLATKFRTGDARFSLVPHKILNIFVYPNGKQPRYLVENHKRNTFTYNELLPA